MAQHDYVISNQSFPNTRSDINSALSAINSSNSGTSRPSAAVQGTVWLDTTNSGSNSLTLKIYDGSDDISIGTIDTSANTINLLDSSTTGVSFKEAGTNFTNSLLVGHSTTGTLNAAEKNVGIGVGTLDATTIADNNTAVGYNAGTTITSGYRNTLLGAEAGEAILNGIYNVVVGSKSGELVNSGGYNTLLGGQAGDNITSGSGNVIIGSVDAGSATGSRQLVIAGNDGSTTTTWISGSSSGVLTFNAANVTQQALTSSSNATAWDASAKPNAFHLTTENTTFAAPSNAVEGAFICVEIQYGGSHTIAFNTVYEFSASTAPTFTSTSGKTDVLVFRYNSAVWQEVGRTLNLSAT